MITLLITYVAEELKEEYAKIMFTNEKNLVEMFNKILSKTGKQFVIIIDEWDCVMRRIHDWKEQKLYLDFLRDFLKDQPYIALAYMTGILPIKKYGEHSTLNMFYEYSMIDSAEISDGFGFTQDEVYELCNRYHMNFDEAKEWYDGYHLISYVGGEKKEYSIYSPKSVVESMLRGRYNAYWNQTETYEALKKYIQLNMDGLKDSIVQMLSGSEVAIDPGAFMNDMYEFHSKDEVLTLLVHLGYLAYLQDKQTVVIPNKEVSLEFLRSINHSAEYEEVARSIKESKELVQALWDMDEERVAQGVEKAHEEISILKYNDENALSCTIQLAFYYAREYYQMVRELPTGKGYADICLIPRPRYTDIPAIIIELKWDKKAQTAIDQIRKKNYPNALKDYKEQLLLCGINYNKASKKHECKIERV
ncbi:N-acetylhexosamine 1-kinase [Lachnospiraceae bacterium TWA4]|nr:N-acetylhexosamine 1-kinase [Lachnospiraceae bacterium TWA4]